MNNSLDQSLSQAAISTFETLAFACADPEPTDEQRSVPVDGAATVRFHGPVTGRVVVRLCGGLLPVISSNMMALDGNPADPMQRDALGELANVICGNVLPALCGAHAVFRLDAPEWSRSPATAPEKAAAAVVLGMDDGRAEIELFLDRQATAEVGTS